ncbi:MAG: hypothetical protein LAQ30_25005 [Acidobacteriia bacterium]|nr:hypothetical protein [Terriglobia bacterium]
MWTRFNYFLTIEAGALGVYFTKGALSATLPLVGCFLSLLWYLISAQDVWFFQEARHRLREFTRCQIVPNVHRWTVCDEERGLDQPWWKYPICFRIPRVGVTHFAAVCPIAFGCLWGILLAMPLSK